MADILFELGCEELPPKALYGLSKALFDGVTKQLKTAGFEFGDSSRWYASPRRLAFQLNGINEQLADKKSERRGPAVAAAFDDQGNAKPAAMGFARSLGVEVSDLSRVDTDKGQYLTYEVLEKGQSIEQVLPEFIAQSIKQLPIPKPMRWGNNDYSFIRPVHWMVLLKDETVVEMNLFGLTTGNQSLGHRFHHNEYVTIPHVKDYVQVLQDAHIMVDQDQREVLIAEQVNAAAAAVNGVAQISPALLSEVSSIVEKPSAVLGEFSKAFLAVPKEALISSMEKHQKYFSVESKDGELMPYFVALANIESKNPAAVKKGFEKVITPRLADARFFWEKDKKRPLRDNIDLLKKMTFEKSLGSYMDKANRVSELMKWMAPKLNFDKDDGLKAAQLMKCDLMSDMVDEFPDLQGLMGGYYAAAQGETEAVAKAIRDQYLPKFAGDDLPETTLGQALSLADKIDTYCGILKSGKKPSGSKDPYGLRRSILGVIAILIESEAPFDVGDLIEESLKTYGIKITELSSEGADSFESVYMEFLNDRIKYKYKGEGVSDDVILAVMAKCKNLPMYDFDQRIQATTDFKNQSYAKSLIEANKRSVNIIDKSDQNYTELCESTVNEELFDSGSEYEAKLFAEIQKLATPFATAVKAKDYVKGYQLLATLAEPLDQYFEHVMVNDENPDIRKNRLTQLAHFSRLTSSVADLSELVKN